MDKLKAIGGLFVLIFLTSALGFVREIYLAKTYGISADIDCFIVAFTIVSAIFFTFSTNTMQSIFMPAYQTLIQSNKQEEGVRLFNSCLKTMVIFLCSLIVLVVLISYYFLGYIVPGFSEAELSLTFSMIKIMSPLILVVGLSNFFISVCNSHGSLVAPVFSQFLYNFLIVLFLVFMGYFSSRYHYIQNVAYVFLVSGIISFLILFVHTLNYIQKKWIFCEGNVFSDFIKNSSFLILLTLMDQLVIIAQRNFGSLMDHGSISSLNYALKIIIFPVSIVSIALATVFFPRFIEIFSQKDKSKSSLTEIFNEGLFLNIYCLLPISIFFLMNSESIISSLFLSQQFDEQAVQKTAKALYFYSFGLLFHGLLIYLNRFYLSCEQQRLFFRIMSFFVGVYLFLSWIFAQVFGYYGIAIATSIYVVLNVFALIHFVKLFMIINFRIQHVIKPLISAFVVYFFLPTVLPVNGIVGLMLQGIWTLAAFYTLLFLMRDKKLTSLLNDFLIQPILRKS